MMVEHGQFRDVGSANLDQKPTTRPENSRFSRFKIAAKVLGPAVMLLAIVSACETQSNPTPDHTPIIDPTCSYFENELIVGAKSEEISEDVQEIFSDFEAQVIRTRSDGKSVWVEVDPEKRDELEKVLDGHPDVEYAEKSFVIKTQQDPCP